MYNTPLFEKKYLLINKYLKKSILCVDFCFITSFFVNKNKKHYPLVFSNECKYIVSKEKIKIMSAVDEELIIDDNDDEFDYEFNKY